MSYIRLTVRQLSDLRNLTYVLHMTYVRQLKDFSAKALASSLVTGRGGATNTSTKVIKMKIGKWLLKVHTYITNAEELREKVRQANPETSFTDNDVVAAIGEKGNADLDRNDSYPLSHQKSNAEAVHSLSDQSQYSSSPENRLEWQYTEMLQMLYSSPAYPWS